MWSHHQTRSTTTEIVVLCGPQSNAGLLTSVCLYCRRETRCLESSYLAVERTAPREELSIVYRIDARPSAVSQCARHSRPRISGYRTAVAACKGKPCSFGEYMHTRGPLLYCTIPAEQWQLRCLDERRPGDSTSCRPIPIRHLLPLTHSRRARAWVGSLAG